MISKSNGAIFNDRNDQRPTFQVHAIIRRLISRKRYETR